MTTYERRQSLLDILRKQSGLRVPELAQMLEVSEGTVRNDLNALEEARRLRRVHGGAVLKDQGQFQNNLFMLRFGGVVNNDSSSVTGLLSERIIEDLHIQKAFFSCSGFSLERGMTEVHLEEAQLKRKAIGSSKQVIALVDSSKMGKKDLTPFAAVEQITHVYTDYASRTLG